jgi:GNAT superfamily N-acetyltransferase
MSLINLKSDDCQNATAPMIKIRKASNSDTPQLEQLFLEVRQNTFTWENPNKFKLEDYQKATEGETVFLAEDDKKIIGFISVWEHDSPAFLHHLFVSKAHQRQGIGRLLIQSISSSIPLPYRLKCIVKNENALDFYLKNNWSIVGKGISEDGDYLLLELPKLDGPLNEN